MSVSSMTNVAFTRRQDQGDPSKGPGTVDEVAKATAAPANSSSAANALAAIATYIPSEIITVYVAVLATLGIAVPASALPGPASSAAPAASALASPVASALASPVASAVTSAATGAGTASPTTPLLPYLLFVVLTPLIVWGLYASKAVSAGKPVPKSVGSWPKWEMFAALVAFAFWGAALPVSPLGTFSWFNAALGGVLVLVAQLLLGVFSPVFTRKALKNQ